MGFCQVSKLLWALSPVQTHVVHDPQLTGALGLPGVPKGQGTGNRRGHGPDPIGSCSLLGSGPHCSLGMAKGGSLENTFPTSDLYHLNQCISLKMISNSMYFFLSSLSSF